MNTKTKLTFKQNQTYYFINTSALSIRGKLIDIDNKTGTATWLLSEDNEGELCNTYKTKILVNSTSPLFDIEYAEIELKAKGCQYIAKFLTTATQIN